VTDWIKHTGDTCPVDPETVVFVRYGSGLVERGRANGFPWWMRNPAGITHYRIITPAKPPEPKMTGFIATLTDEQKAAALAYCGDDHHGPPKPEPDLITLRLECLKLAVAADPQGLWDDGVVGLADYLLHYVLNGSEAARD
jgi:hypothetical protein